MKYCTFIDTVNEMNDIYMLRYMYKYVKLQYVKVFLFDLAVVP